MPTLARLLKIGSMADSMGVYVPATALQKALGLGRILLFVHLTAHVPVEYNLWASGAMIFDILAQVVCLGSNNSMGRYVSFYEARGKLGEFYRSVRWKLLILCLALTACALAGTDWIRKLAITTEAGQADTSTFDQTIVCWAALLNVLVMALYLNLTGFLYGMRAYRLASAVEVMFSVAFTVLGVGVLLMWTSGLAILLAHSASIVICTAFGLIMLHIALRRAAQPPSAVYAADSPPDRPFARVIWFGLATLVPNLLWLVVVYISYRITSWQLGPVEGAKFQAFLRLDQQVFFLAAAAWAVVFSHVAKRWESSQRDQAMRSLETSYKAVAMATMTLSILLYATVPLWVLALPAEYRAGADLAGGQLMFFQAMTQLSLMTILTKLHERPWVMAAAALAGGGLNVALALAWLPEHGAVGASMGAGVGMYVGGVAVSIAYFVLARIRLHASTYFVLLAPAILLLPTWACTVAWTVVILAALLTGWLFDADQKATLRAAIISMWNSYRHALRPGRTKDGRLG